VFGSCELVQARLRTNATVACTDTRAILVPRSSFTSFTVLAGGRKSGRHPAAHTRIQYHGVIAAILVLILGVGALAHMAPFPFLIEAFRPSRSLWHIKPEKGAPAGHLPEL
jgi:hypothetical protein